MDHQFYSLRVVEVRQESPDSVSLVFENHSQFNHYLSGQFLTIKANIEGEYIRRAYSLCSSPVAGEPLAVTVKKVTGGKMSSWIYDKVKGGSMLEVMPPIGNFVFRPHSSKKRWFMLYAAGSGITPVYSMLKSILISEPQSFVSLLFGNRTTQDIMYKDSLQTLCDKYPSRFKVVHCLSQPDENWFGERGRIDEELIMHTLEYLKPVSPFEETLVYMCGPVQMMDVASVVVEQQGVKKENIHRESFTASIDKAAIEASVEELEIRDRTIEVQLDGKSFQVLVSRGKTILDAALDKDLDMPYSCQSGLCTACRGKCLVGKVHMDEREGLSDEEIEEGYVLTCVGHPLTDGVVIEMG
jgi:ring-1,2-phenylacetyl-CoA epoxidase subunit PaaE